MIACQQIKQAEEMDKFLETYNLQELNHEEIECFNRPFIGKDTESVTDNFPTNKTPGLDGFTSEFYQTFNIHTHPSQKCQKN